MSVISFILFGFFSRSWYLFESAELGHCCCCNGNIFFTILTEQVLFNCCFIKRSSNTLTSWFLRMLSRYMHDLRQSYSSESVHRPVGYLVNQPIFPNILHNVEQALLTHYFKLTNNIRSVSTRKWFRGPRSLIGDTLIFIHWGRIRSYIRKEMKGRRKFIFGAEDSICMGYKILTKLIWILIINCASKVSTQRFI